MLDFHSLLTARGVIAGLVAVALFPALAGAEITASADFPLSPVAKAIKADPHAKLLELYRQDVMAGQSGSKQKTPTGPSSPDLR